MIQRVMAEEGVPQDLIYLAVAESGFQPQAVNRRSRAGGMWQFMPDRRLRPDAQRLRGRALRSRKIHPRLRPLHEVPLRPARRLVPGHGRLRPGRRQRAARSPEDRLRRLLGALQAQRTARAKPQNYVPEILAAIIIANHPTQYGFDDVTLDPPVLTDTVTINYSIDLRLVSDLVGAPVDEIEALNPSLLRMVTPPDAPFDLHLPAGTATLFEQRVALIPEAKRNSWRYHPVVAGRHAGVGGAGVSRPGGANWPPPINSAPTDSVAGHRGAGGSGAAGRRALRAPGFTPCAGAIPWSPSQTASASRSSQLRRWNRIPSGIRVEPGRRLHVAEPAPCARPSAHRRRTSAAGATRRQAAPSPSGDRRQPRLRRPSRQSLRSKAGRSVRQKPSHCDGSERRSHGAAHKPAGRPRLVAARKNRRNLHSCLCFACVCVQAIATIACASRMFSSALRKCETKI